MSKIRILITGGTIDDLEYQKEADDPKRTTSLIPDLLKQARVTSDYQCEILMMKDSRFVREAEQQIILQKCIECPEDKIVITHGTMTMTNTAKVLGEKNLDKTIVLFGSHIPANKDNSDALFNFGTAMAVVELSKPGVYITMNGKIFPWGNCQKNMETGCFE